MAVSVTTSLRDCQTLPPKTEPDEQQKAERAAASLQALRDRLTLFKGRIERDANLITGQNPHSRAALTSLRCRPLP